MTHSRYGPKYDTRLVANLLLTESNSESIFKIGPIFLKVMNEYRVARFSWPTVYKADSNGRKNTVKVHDNADSNWTYNNK